MNAARSMHATIAHFATCLPDWNSLDSVRRAHSELEAVALVFFALLVVFDVLAHLSSENKTKETLFEKIALICFAVAVLAEIAAYPYGQRNDVLSEHIIGSLDVKAREAFTNASNALTKASEAETKSDAANTVSGKARDKADAAGKKADSFEADIVSAKKLAAEAESHLADALQRAANAEAELERMKAPRSLTNASALTDALTAFKGTEYSFIGCFQDQESIDLLVQIDKVLANAGWTRVKPPPQGSFGDIQLNISKDFGVPVTSRSGIYVGVQSTETVDVLKATPQPMLPTYIRAALALKAGLASGIVPVDEGLTTPLPADPGNSTSVFIVVGKKP